MFIDRNRNLRSCFGLAGAVGFSLLLLNAAAGGQESGATKAGKLPYQDASLPIQARVADLLPRMTLDEKVNELVWAADSAQSRVQVIDPTGTYTDKTARQALAAE